MANLRQLNVAASNGDLRKVEKLVAESLSLNQLNAEGLAPLHYASQAGHAEVCRVLLAAGADVNLPSSHGNSPLAVAAGNSHADVVRVLLEAGADVNQRNPDPHPLNAGRTPLMHAAMQNKLPVVKLLVEAGADLLAATAGGLTAINMATTWGGKKVLRYLQEAAAERAPEQPMTLHEAARNGLADKVRALLPAVVNIDEVDSQRQTALKYAAREGHARVVAVLLEAGASPDFAPDGEPPLVAAAGRAHVSIVHRLLEAGADVNGRGRNGGGLKDLTPLQAAAALGNLATVKVLIDHGADPALVDEEGQTALDWAVKARRPKIAAYLREQMGLPAEPTASTRFHEASEQPAFQVLADRLAALQGRPAYDWKRKGVFRFYFNSARLPALGEHFGVSIDGLDADARRNLLDDLLGRLQDEARQAGFHLVFGGGSSSTPPMLLFPTDDKYAVIAACGTNANRHTVIDGRELFLGAREISNWLRELDQSNPFMLTECGFDFLGGRFLGPVADAEALAARFVELCPEYESLEEAAREIARGHFYFWWD
ncbi:MAG: ankyrin repeat domain-containing protein [Gemmataceae bacterium]